MLVLKQKGSYSGIVLISSVYLFLGFGGILEFAKIFFKKGSSLTTAEFSSTVFLCLEGALKRN